MSTQPTPELASSSAKHETTDVRSTPLVFSALVLAVAVALVCVFLIWFFGRLENHARRHDPRLSPLVGSQTPPAPRLQTSPASDLARMREAEDQALHRYRWIDKERGTVQLPIDRAMALLLEEGLPETKAETPDAKGPRDESTDKKEAGR
ncbi:MAG TPA: hypothetical protein VG826_22560 [Pirellulales bacterium]|nr:hypothetical protein [Pirellulales bacterium]